MKFLLFIALLFSTPLYACWNMKINLKVNTQALEINQKIKHDKTYTFVSGQFHYHFKIYSQKNQKSHVLDLEVVEKKGLEMILVFQEKMIISEGKEVILEKEDLNGKYTIFFKILLTHN